MAADDRDLAALPSGRITLLLTDVEGSTAAWDQDPVGMDAQMERHDAFAASTIAGHGGRLLKTKGEGDSTFSVFSDAHAAVAAALDLIRGLPGVEFALPVRAAVHTGEVVPRAGDYFGPVPNRAARLRGLAAGGQILLSASVVAAIGGRVPDDAAVVALGVHQLRGLAEPEEVFGLGHPELRAVEPLVVVHPPSNLPAPVDAFVGRDDDRTAFEKALGRHRLVTIVGPGGVGKTRLALETVADQAHAMTGGTWFVDVGALASPEQLGTAVVSAVGGELESGADAAARVAQTLPGRALLLLDTCEAHLDAVAEFSEALLAASGDVLIVATSREAIGVRGEAILRLDPLAAGASDDGPSDAARLFMMRATAADLGGDGALDPALVEQICVELDGIPLAIELAASQVGVLDLAELASQLASAVGVEETRSVRRSGPARQRTVRATVEWSLQRATAEERALLAGLTAFVGGWPQGAPEAVCLNDDTLDERAVTFALRGLSSRSLVVTSPDTGAGLRHRILDSVRTIAREHLTPEERKALADRHLAWCVTRATTLDDDASTGELPDFLNYFNAEMPNFRAAMTHALATDCAGAAQVIGAASFNALQEAGAFAEAIAILRAAVGGGGDGAPRARALAALALALARTGVWEEAAAASAEATAIVRNDPALPDLLRAEVLGIETILRSHADESDAAKAASYEMLEAARRSGDRMVTAIALNNVAVNLDPAEQLERVRIFEEAAAVEAEVGAAISARLQLATALGLGGYSARGLAVVEALELVAPRSGEYSTFLIERARANLLLELGRFEEAIDAASRALRTAELLGLDEDDLDEARDTVARSQIGLGDYDAALATLDLLRSDYWRGLASLRRVDAFLALGRVHDAVANLPDGAFGVDAASDVASAKVALAQNRPADALAIAAPHRERLTRVELGFFEMRLLKVEIAALEALGRTDELVLARARRSELETRLIGE